MATLLLEPTTPQASLFDPFPPEGGEEELDRGRVAQPHHVRSRQNVPGGLTLDDLITGVWEGLAIRDVVSCPACGGTMESRRSTSGGEPHGHCRDCGANLS